MSVISEGVLQQKIFSIEWKIERFFVDCKNVEDFHKSDTFQISYANQITNWYLKIYPRGYIADIDDTKSKDYVSLFLFYESENVPEVSVNYKFSVVGDKKKLSRQDTSTFVGTADNWGDSEFVKHDVLKDPNNGALVNDTLIILCEMTFHQTGQKDKKIIEKYKNLLNSIGKRFANYEALLENNYYTDVTFNIQDKKICLHKAILMCQNTVFKAMFEHEMKENQESIVNITDVDFPVMMELFRFIYSGKVENIEEIVKDLLIAADKYCVVELKALCEKTLYHSLTAENAIEYLKLTGKCDTLHLKKLVMEFVVDNLNDIVQKSDFDLLFADISRKVVCEIMKAVGKKMEKIKV